MSRRAWSADEDATLRRLLAEGATTAAIGAALGRSASAVKGRVYKLRLREPISREPRGTEEDDRTLLRMLAAGKSCADIAGALGCSRKAVHVRMYRLRRAGVHVPAANPGPRRMSDAERAEIVRLFRSGLTQVQIASTVGRSADAVRRVLATEGELSSQRSDPPPEVLAERAARLARPQTLTAALLGDPPPGYSALDRMPGARHG